MKKWITTLAIILSVTACGGTTTIKEKTMQSNKQKVIELLKSIETGDSKPASYINPDKYIQHNLAVKDGLAGFGEVLAQLPEGSAKVEVIRAFADGDFVFTHTKYDFFGPKAGFDIFRFEEGLIVEHWDNLQPIADGPNASGHTQFDGVTTIEDKHLTQANKEIVRAFVNDVLLGKAPQRITEYIGQTYIQHNPHVADGLQGLLDALKALEEMGMPMRYSKNHMIMGEGNFVLSVSEGKFMDKHVAFYDLFRLKDGKLVEHWDVIEPIPPKEEWQNDNGKF